MIRLFVSSRITSFVVLRFSLDDGVRASQTSSDASRSILSFLDTDVCPRACNPCVIETRRIGSGWRGIDWKRAKVGAAGIRSCLLAADRSRHDTNNASKDRRYQ
ncbi:MAG: hypothetical protein DWQ08_09145 [Proteobacteria bacterium]|nr:MAG: hypothetical protein DWQ08_09145 [Pseudomonadota bacterium]